jgi:nitroimidazol reductase NimA-like FMN-containing flavoprotein (pyridoxamine 5'-phosphate oxidase superfamily)
VCPISHGGARRHRVRKLLAGRHLGRLAIPDWDGPMIFPVNDVFDQDLVIFRTDPGSKLDVATEGESVAFEVDATDEATRTGWSVVVRGTLAEIIDPADLARLRALPLYPWAAWRDDPVRARPAAVDHRPPHQDPRRPAGHLVGLSDPGA